VAPLHRANILSSVNQTGFAARAFKTSRVIHWLTVALVSGLLVTALFEGIDPHGTGNSAFLWHSSLGISVYLLSISRVLLWLLYRPMAIPAVAPGKFATVDRGLRFAFYALLIALPISGWIIASEEGMPAHFFGMPALPQWYQREPARQFTADRATGPHEIRSNDKSVVIHLRRIHATLAGVLSAVVVIHVLTVIRVRARRRD
jgi:cytochrome b561